MKIIHTEETPNPAAYKFILEGLVVSSGTKSFSLQEEDDEYTGDDPLAQALFKVGAMEIFLCQNYVSVTLFSARGWEYFRTDVKNAIEAHTHPLGEAPQEKQKKASVLDTLDRETFPGLPDVEKRGIIDSLMDEIIRPALANDGGGLELLKVEGHEVVIKYQGACGSCPSSQGATLNAIQRALRGYLDPDIEVSISAGT
ncbi:MAG: hypothetical protein COV76_03430 [Candidatus Omnitrophica bacterium CG11_big_fil_rev_8_21_14_0_20_64_10]|nr:MAG: hypothetical protein COV76_03430 [Candidatus Omnitrophica bacterium CG11_big_fil_rev_8_21_14_0_20_64_10]